MLCKQAAPGPGRGIDLNGNAARKFTPSTKHDPEYKQSNFARGGVVHELSLP